MNKRVLAPKADAAAVRSIMCASIFVFAGVLRPVLCFVGEAHEPDVLLGPLLLNGAMFLIAHVLACVSLSQGSGASVTEGKKMIRSIWGISAMTFLLMVYWDLKEGVRL